jgi:hypothetical protein
MKTLSEIFTAENSRTPHLLSAAGGSNDHDADASEKLKLLRKVIGEGKVLRKPGGTIYSDDELLALPYNSFLALYMASPAENPPGRRGESPDEVKTCAAVDLRDVFNSENGLTLLSAKLDRTPFGADQAEKVEVLESFLALGKLPKDENGKILKVEKLIELPTPTLKLLLAQMR